MILERLDMYTLLDLEQWYSWALFFIYTQIELTKLLELDSGLDP